MVALLIAGAALAVCIFVTSDRIAAERRPTSTGPLRPDPGLGMASARTRVQVTFESLLFSGDRFPTYDLKRPSLIEERLGPCTVRATFFDRDGRTVDVPTEPGPYAAIVEVVPEKGRPIRRYATLVRTTAPLPNDESFDPAHPDSLAVSLGIEPRIVARQAGAITRTFAGRSYWDLARDQSAVRLLAGLILGQKDSGDPRPWCDASAAERRWWVRIKRRESDLYGVYRRPWVAPKVNFGKAAPTLREGTAAEAGFRPEKLEDLDALLREWAADSDQAFAICLARRGVVVFHRAYGIRDGRPMTVDTKSWMASVTKPMSATLMMTLVDDGILSLDDRVSDILPALAGLKSDRPITLRHLYTHTHTLEFWLKPVDELPDFEERIADCYPAAHAGRIWNYNGVGYVLGGKVIEDVTGESIPDAFRAHLLAPMGMDQTDVSGTYGDARSVPLDIAKFGQMLLNGGAYGNHRFLSEPTFRAMLPQRLTTVLGPNANKAFGIGLDGDIREFFHGAASGATFRVNRADETVLVMTRDKRGKNYDKYHDRFLEAVKDAVLK